jgi:hypothetical protein
MISRRVIIILIISYALGLASGAAYYLKIKPSKEQQEDMQVDASIREELCSRLFEDISKFKESPQSFQRSSLKVLISESSITTKALLPYLPEGKLIGYKSLNGKSIVSDCQDKARQWVKIPSAFPDQYETELALIEHDLISNHVLSITESQPVANSSKNTGARIALVIGNSEYKNRPLKNPINDAKDIADTLRKSNFKVIELYNADQAEMRETINQFSEKLVNYDVGLVYYSGHGIELSGRNYFIPINAQINSEDEIPRQAFDATEIVEKMSRSNVKTSIFIIDACRNTPIFSKFKSAESGLAIMHGSTGTVVAFSAAPGHVAQDGNGRNSPYTSALIKQMNIPNKKIEDVMKDTAKLVTAETASRQTPWYNSSLTGDFYFRVE